jgi:membrane protein DedA with SNARE-associated domain
MKLIHHSFSFTQQVDRTKRFDKYSRSELLCGTDGLPHLIADGRWSHAAEFILPGLVLSILLAGLVGLVEIYSCCKYNKKILLKVKSLLMFH